MGILKFIESVCVQPAVYWTGSPDGYGGYSWSVPQKVKVRWDDQAELVTDSEGKEVVSRARIMVATELVSGGRLWLGDLYDLNDGQKEDPMKLESYEIKRVDKNPLFKSKDEFVYTVYL